MSEDIVARLRNQSLWSDESSSAALLIEAVAEIEKLRAQLVDADLNVSKLSVKNMTKEQMELVAAARTTVVRKFRNKEGGWDRPDTAADPWYKPEEWDDDGNYYGPPKAMLPVPVYIAVDTAVPELTDPSKFTDEPSTLTDPAKKEKRRAYMREYMKKKRVDTGE